MFGRKPRLPDNWETTAARVVPHWDRCDEDEREAFAATLEWALADISWEPVAGFELTDAMRVTLAASVASVAWNLDADHLRATEVFIVWPDVIERRPEPVPVTDTMRLGDLKFVIHNDPYVLNGPLVLSWSEVADDVAHPERGRNAVMRAVAVAVDLADGAIDGTPAFGDDELRAAWIAAATPVFDQLDRGHPCPPLDPSGGDDAAAFLGAVTEAFLLNGPALAEHLPALYDLLVTFYGQDPAERAKRPG